MKIGNRRDCRACGCMACSADGGSDWIKMRNSEQGMPTLAESKTTDGRDDVPSYRGMVKCSVALSRWLCLEGQRGRESALTAGLRRRGAAAGLIPRASAVHSASATVGATGWC
jgi:hypothetical protein